MNDCVLWPAPNSNGYGPHRKVYERERGPIPEGLDLDHLCRNRACVNPDHLEPVTRRENLRRGLNFKPLDLYVEGVTMRANGWSWRKIARSLGGCHKTIKQKVLELNGGEDPRA
jgi:hypothetical protein